MNLADQKSRNQELGYSTPLSEGKTKGMYYFFSKTKEDLPNYDSVFNSVEIPVSIIWGMGDDMLKFEPQREKVINRFNVKTTDIHVIEGSHFIQEEFPETLNQIMIEFYEKNNL